MIKILYKVSNVFAGRCLRLIAFIIKFSVTFDECSNCEGVFGFRKF